MVRYRKFLGVAACVLGAFAWLVGLATAEPDFYAHVPTQPVAYDPGLRPEPEELLPVQIRGGWGYIDRRGRLVVPPRYEWTDYFYPSTAARQGNLSWRARVQDNGRTAWLLVWSDERKVLRKASTYEIENVEHAWFDRLVDNHMVTRKSLGERYRYGLDTMSRDTSLENKFDGVLRPSSDDLVAFELDGRCGFAYRNGKIVIEPRFAEASSFRQNYAAVRLSDEEGGRWGFVDKTGKMSFTDKHGELQALRGFSHGMAAIRAGGKWGFLDRRFAPVIRPRYDEVRDFSAKYAAVRRGDEWEFINRSGKKLAGGFEEAYHFEDPVRSGLSEAHQDLASPKLALIKRGGLYGYIDVSGKLRVPAVFVSATPFYRGVGRVALGDSFGYIDATGKLIWDPRQADRHGIVGWELDPPRTSYWRGLPTQGVDAQPYPFEHEVLDHLPLAPVRPLKMSERSQ